ncbi:hypothetical protein BGZ61DRAFT_463919 [Ilyonectria robusta]|uniref:uncharacterized protein n=1 Tax=Ilyonectria robusta TaxID=1079257 RepID=UPI001E8D3EB4|nr:uncharacterized protein BGZ61DRAFT_463919 [Ilyonectria robusta]KAH8661279.1 hypothetical protein BGZ61DRAFT_463919 [Ilyonectria robusta]
MSRHRRCAGHNSTGLYATRGCDGAGQRDGGSGRVTQTQDGRDVKTTLGGEAHSARQSTVYIAKS